MKAYFVVNPQSGNGATGRRWGELSARLARTAPGFEVGFTQGPMDAAALATRALDAGFDAVVAVGGDGTINEVVNGFFRDGKAINPEAALGVLPRGTGGDFRKTFGWTLDVDEAAQRLASGATRPLDAGLLECRGRDGAPVRRYFANICSFGVSGVVDAEVNRSSKLLGGKLSFMLGSLKGLLKYTDKPVRVSFDGKAPELLTVTTLAVAIGKYFGGGMKVAPEADVSDGLFDVTVWSGYGLSDFVLRSAGVYDGSHVRWKGTRTLRCARVAAESDEEVLIDCDGEQPGTLPCSMTVLPGALRLLG